MNADETRLKLVRNVGRLVVARTDDAAVASAIDAAAIAHALELFKRTASPRGECCEKMRHNRNVTENILIDYVGTVLWVDCTNGTVQITYCPFCGAYCGPEKGKE